MRNDDKISGKTTPVTRFGQRVVTELAQRSGADLNSSRSILGAMSEQKQDWSRGNACIPQTFVRLVGYRDPDARPSSPLPRRPLAIRRKPIPSDTPIG